MVITCVANTKNLGAGARRAAADCRRRAGGKRRKVGRRHRLQHPAAPCPTSSPPSPSAARSTPSVDVRKQGICCWRGHRRGSRCACRTSLRTSFVPTHQRAEAAAEARAAIIASDGAVACRRRRRLWRIATQATLPLRAPSIGWRQSCASKEYALRASLVNESSIS